MRAISFYANLFIGVGYLVGWILLVVGLGHNRWICKSQITVEVLPWNNDCLTSIDVVESTAIETVFKILHQMVSTLL